MDNKKDGGILTGWQFHTLSVTPEKARELGVDVKTEKVMKMSATVVEDRLGRWEPGDHMTSSIIINFDEENMIVETRNTIYHLEGEAGDSLPDLGDGIMAIFY